MLNNLQIDKFQWQQIIDYLKSKKFATELSKEKQKEILELIEKFVKGEQEWMNQYMKK